MSDIAHSLRLLYQNWARFLLDHMQLSKGIFVILLRYNVHVEIFSYLIEID